MVLIQSMSASRRSTIWSNAALPPRAESLLRETLAAHELVFASRPVDNLATSAADASIASAEIVFGQPDPAAALRAPKLRWIHLTSAGYTRYDTDAFRDEMAQRGIRLTTSSSVYAEPCAQHLLAMILAIGRQLPASLDTQRTTRAWPMAERRADCRLLGRQRVLLLGFGAIARRLCALLEPFGTSITAFRRHAAEPGRVRFVHEDELAAALAAADHVVDVLPESASTRQFMNAARLGLMKPGACFYNVGRGDTVEQTALLHALTSGRLGAAYLDVTSPEPLPPEHPLWSAPRCFITPHIAGGHDDEAERLVRHFADNLEAFLQARPLRDRVMGSAA